MAVFNNNKNAYRASFNVPQRKTLHFCLAMSDFLCLTAVSESKCRWELSNDPSCQEAASWVLKPSLLFTIWLQRHRHHVNCFVKGGTDWLSGPSIQSNVWFTKAKSSHIPSKWQNLDSNQDCSTSLQHIKCLYAPHHHQIPMSLSLTT